jgi:rhamnose transport system substrate-binding protein
VKLKAGATFSAGSLGKYKILPPAAGTGLSVVLGPPTVFDKANVRKFNF